MPQHLALAKAFDDDRVTRCHLIVSTTRNNPPLDAAVRPFPRAQLDAPELPGGLLDPIDVAIRAYDLCLSFVTQALCQMPL